VPDRAEPELEILGVLASVNLDGKMVDIPVYRRSQVILDRARAVAETERRKAEELARLA
jgi:hypothetical protein